MGVLETRRALWERSPAVCLCPVCVCLEAQSGAEQRMRAQHANQDRYRYG